MALLGVLDYWTFQFNPLQKNIFLDKEKGAYKFYRTGSAISDAQESLGGALRQSDPHMSGGFLS